MKLYIKFFYALMSTLSLMSIMSMTCNNPANPYDSINTKIYLYARSVARTTSSTGIDDSVGNTIYIGCNSNLPANIDSVQLKYIIQYSGSSKDSTFGIFKNLSWKNSSDTLCDSLVFSDSGTKIITGTAYINNNTTISDSIIATIHLKPANHKPILNVTGDTTITVAQTCSLTVFVSDVDSLQTHSFSVLKKPLSGSFVNPTFIWKPSSDNIGKDTVIFMVSDNGYPVMSDTDSLVITVRDTSTATDLQVPTLRFINPSKDTVIGADSCIVSVICKDASGIESLKCYLDATSFTTAQSSTADSIYTATIKGLKAGQYNNIKFVATDASSKANKDSITINIKYDNDITKPSVSLVTPAKDTISTSSSSYTITIKCADASGIASVIGVKGSVIDTGEAGTDSTYTIQVSNLTQGNYDTVKITVTDNSLRANKATQNIMIKYDPSLEDKDGPTINRISGPRTGDTVSSSGFTLVDSITDPSGVDSVYAKVTGGTQTVLVVANNKYTFAGTLQEGADTITVTAKDKSVAGNWSTQTITVYYIIAPTIAAQPSAVTTYPSTSASFSVTASGTGTLTYTWYKGATVKGTASTYTISSVTAGDTGYYKVVVSNYSGADTSDSVKLSLTRYYVAFNSNGGSKVDTQWVICNSYAKAPASPAKSGYKFTGWHTDQELTSATFDFSSSSNVITTDRTLYASWDKTYKLTFDSQNADVAANPDTMIVVTGKTVDSFPTAPSKTSYVFNGWYTGENGAGTQFTQSTTVTADVTVYAYWVIKDYDGNIYTEVTIGTQTWMVENLRTTKYNDGTSIPKVTDSTAWSNLATAGYCYYNNTTNADSIKKFGALYNWYAVNTGKLAPAGWHVPTDAEWDTLQNYLIANGYNYDNTTADNKIAKSMAATTDWASSTDTGAIGNDLSKNNKSGFSAVPGGFRYFNGNFYFQGSYGHWWSFTEFDASYAWSRSLYYYNDYLFRSYYIKVHGFSVRLLRD
jgi:uncharacterized protein (TIGR02145 family)/uncharacterized repeat protein (TIGR02543 family)